MYELAEVRAAIRLVEWSLHPLARPANTPAYRELIARYTSSFAFRDLVHAAAEEWGLQVLDVSSFGIAVAPAETSVFAMTANDYRPSGTADDHLLDGLILIAIQATVYPLAQDLLEDPTVAHHAITAEEVDQTLRSICDHLEQRAQKEPDIPLASVEQRLHAAYLVYKARPQNRTGKNGKPVSSSTIAMIERALKVLQSQGCFLPKRQGKTQSYQPTWRFQIQVQDWSATELYLAIKTILTQPTKEA